MKRSWDHEEVYVFWPPDFSKRWKPSESIMENATAPSCTSPTALDEPHFATKITARNAGTSLPVTSERLFVLDISPPQQPKARTGANGTDGYIGIPGANGKEGSHVCDLFSIFNKDSCT
jgi:hypothetical protein